jgi:uncharacterized membrane protein YbhN (UPF0104 family)
MAGKVLEGAKRVATHKVTLRVLWLVFIGVVVYALLPTLTRMPEQTRQALEIKWYALGIGVLLELAAQVAGMLAFRRVLDSMGVDPCPRRIALARLWFAQSTMAAILPGGSVTATVMVTEVLRRDGANTTRAATATGLAKAISFVGLLVFFVIGLAMSIDRLSDTRSPYLTATIVAVPILAVGLSVVGAGVVRPALAGAVTTAALRPVARVRRGVDPEASGRRAAELAGLARTLRGSREGALTAAISFLYWVLDCSVLVVMLWGLGLLDGIGPVIVAYTVGLIAAMLPITPGGIGIVEVIMTAVLAAFGTPGQVAAISVIAYRLISFWLVNGIGAVAMATIRRGKGREAAAAPG